jgi:hypothetical protein
VLATSHASSADDGAAKVERSRSKGREIEKLTLALIHTRKHLDRKKWRILSEKSTDGKPRKLQGKLARKLQDLKAREKKHLELLVDHVDEAHLTLGSFPTDDQIRNLRLVEKYYAKFQAHLARPLDRKTSRTVHRGGGGLVQTSDHVDTEATTQGNGEIPRQGNSGDTTALAPRHLLQETTKKLMHRRDQLDESLIREDERSPVGKKVYNRRNNLLEKQRQLQQDELEHLRALVSRYAQARHRLSRNRCGRYIKEEHRLRHVIAIFKAHLGPYLGDLDFDTADLCSKSDEKGATEPNLDSAGDPLQPKRKPAMGQVKDKRPNRPKPAQIPEAPQSTPRRSGDSAEKRASWSNNILQLVLRQGPGDQDALEARRAEDRRRLDLIVAPHLDDNGIVYDLPPIQMEMDPDVYMAGGLAPPENKYAPAQSDDSCASEAPLRQLRKNRSTSRRIVLSSSSSSSSDAGDHGKEDDGNGQLTPKSYGISKLSSPMPAITPDHSYRGIAEGGSTQVSQVSKPSSTKTPTSMPRVWGSPGTRYRDGGTRISGPYTPALPSLKVDDPGQKSYDCLQACSSWEHVGQADESRNQDKTRKARSSSSPWHGKSTTPVPLPFMPIGVATSSARVTKSKSLSVTKSESTPTSGEKRGRCQAAGKSRAVVRSPSEYELSPGSIQYGLQVAACFSGTAEGDRAALEVERKRWRRILNL